jgi:hypothetical protein
LPSPRLKPRTLLRTTILVLVLGSAIGCTDTKHSTDPAGAGGPFGGQGASGAAGASNSPRNPRTVLDVPIDPALLPGAPEAVPLLERASTAELSCAVAQPLELLGMADAVPVQLAGNTWLVHSASPAADPTGVFLSPVSADGVVGEAQLVYDVSSRAPGLRTTRDLQVVASSERMTLLWTHEVDELGPTGEAAPELLAAQFGAQGEPLTEPMALSRRRMTVSSVLAVGTAGGLAAIWTETDRTASRTLLRFARLDANGELIGTQETLWEQREHLQAASLTPLGDELLATYSSDAYDADESGYFSVVLGMDGQQKDARVHLGSFAPTARLVREERMLAAWTVDHQLPPTAAARGSGLESSRAITVRLGWFDRGGKSIGASYDLQAPVADQRHLAPVLVDLGTDVAVIWSRGSIVDGPTVAYVPDNQLRLVVLDGTSLTPKSDVLSVPNTRSGGGLLPVHVQRMGSELFVVASVHYHADSDLAAVTLHCAP